MGKTWSIPYVTGSALPLGILGFAITELLNENKQTEIPIEDLMYTAGSPRDWFSGFQKQPKRGRCPACKTGERDERWLESLLLFLANKPAKKWSDIDRDGVDLKLAKYSRRLLDLRSLQVSHERRATRNKNFDIILLKAMRHGKTENERAVCIAM